MKKYILAVAVILTASAALAQDLSYNAKKLIAGKDKEELFVYFKKYLEIKDKLRADTVSLAILKIDNSAEVKYNLSLTYYKFLGITEVNRLFLSAGNDIKSNRAYLIARRTTEIKNQHDMIWARYYNIVQLDVAWSRIDKSDSLKIQMGQHYNSLAWYSLLTKQAGKARYYLDKSIRYDPKSRYYNTNYPHVLLFNGEYVKAKALYLKYKDLPFDQDYPSYKDVFLEDFKEFDKAGLSNEHLKEITALLNN